MSIKFLTEYGGTVSYKMNQRTYNEDRFIFWTFALEIERQSPNGKMQIIDEHHGSWHSTRRLPVSNPVLRLPTQPAVCTDLDQLQERTVVSNRLQLYLDALENWTDKWKIRINPGKSEAVMFTTRRIIPPYAI